VLYLVLFQEQKLGPRRHLLRHAGRSAPALAFRLLHHLPNAFMQHRRLRGRRDGRDSPAVVLGLFAQSVGPWIEYAHTMVGATITGSFTVAATAAFYILQDRDLAVAKDARRPLVVGTMGAFRRGPFRPAIAGENGPRPPTGNFAAMEGHFHTEVAGMT